MLHFTTQNGNVLKKFTVEGNVLFAIPPTRIPRIPSMQL